MTRRSEPWERQPGEGAKAYQAFALYRDAGIERSADKVAATLGKSRNMLYRWSVAHSWVLRASSFDRHEDRIFQLARRAQQRRAADRQARIAGAMMSKLVERLQSLDVAKMSLREMAHWLDVTAKVERQALGIADKVEITGADGGPVEVAVLSDEDRHARLVELRREADARIAAITAGGAYHDEPDLDNQEDP